MKESSKFNENLKIMLKINVLSCMKIKLYGWRDGTKLKE